jgi:hypothetical protein
MTAAPLASIPVGVLVERSKADSPWTDHHWRPVSVLVGEPGTPPWTKIAEAGERATFYAGAAAIELHRTETPNYRANLESGSPMLWIVLRPANAEPPYALHLVTADPAEGEAMTEAGNDIVEPVPMPEAIRSAIAAFIAEHHVERVFVKRKREPANPESLGRRTPSTGRDK